MSVLIREANELWWVPASAPHRLAVQIDSLDQYEAALLEKVRALVDKAGGEEAALALVNRVLAEWNQPPLEPNWNKDLAELLLETEPLEELAYWASPERDQPAKEEMARGAIHAQDELELLGLIL